MLVNKQNQEITFITSTMNSTGSEIALLNLLNQIAKTIKANIISKYKGNLFDKTPSSINKQFVLNRIPSQSIVDRIKARIEISTRFNKILSSKTNSIFYINTIILPEVLKFVEKNKIKTIVHIHELEHMYKQLTEDQIKRLVNYPDLIIANSQSSATVIKKFGRRKEIRICYPSIETEKIKKNKNIYSQYRKKLNIPESTFLWVMSGTLDSNKNPFLFIEIATEILKQKNNVKFLWIGGTQNKKFENRCKQKTKENNLSEKIIWMKDVGEDYYNYLNCADGFVLTSEHESFSMVTVEALLLGLPIVTQDCGGVKEILRNDIGKIVVEKNNPELIADEMIKFMNGEYKIDVLQQIERAKEYDSNVIGKRWNQILNEFFKNNL